MDKKYEGMILLNKSKNISSRKDIDNVSRILGIKTGHIGTLDPMATGVLPVLLGNACKLSKYLITHDKSYFLEFVIGKETDTLDETGNIIFENTQNEIEKAEKQIKKDIENNDIYEKISGICGKYIQIPPIFSAKKYNGQKLYDVARIDQKKAEEIAKLKAKEIEVYGITDISFKDNKIAMNVSCSSGTYIRSIVRDFGKIYNIYACMTKLVRTSVDVFPIENTISLSEFMEIDEEKQDYRLYIKDLENEQKEKIKNALDLKYIDIEDVLKSITKKKVTLKDHRIKAFNNGLTTNVYKEDGLYLVYLEDGKIYALR